MTELMERVEGLSPAKRRLLEQRMGARNGASSDDARVAFWRARLAGAPVL